MICPICHKNIDDWDAEKCPDCDHVFTEEEKEKMHDDFTDWYFEDYI